MFVLCIVRTSALDGDKAVLRFVTQTKKDALKILAAYGDCLAWRLWHTGWIDGTENAWKWIVNVEGPAEIVLLV